MAQEEEKRKIEAEKIQKNLEESKKKEQGNEITQMFDRLKNENELRRGEIHGLKDILVRENENRVKEIQGVRDALEVNVQTINESMKNDKEDVLKRIKLSDEDLSASIIATKKELREKIDNESKDIRKKIDMETNGLEDKIQIEKKSLTTKMEEDEDDRRKELRLITAHIKKDRDDLRDQMESDAKTLLNQLEKDSNEIIALMKREKADREKEQNIIKERMANEKKELQISIDKDRDNLTRKLNEEHDMRRLEQMEMQQRLDNAEKQGKSDITELYQKIKKEADVRESDNTELLNIQKNDRNIIEEKIIKERQALREVIDGENLDLNKRLDKVNSDRLNDTNELQGKMALFGKSASRHIDNLKHSIYKECQLLDDSYSAGGEDYITFTGTNVNIGHHMDPKSGIFLVPEDGVYLFLISVCTYDMKKCLLSIRKNGKDVSNLFDQDGMENKGKTMIGQNIVLEVCKGDRIQIYAYTSTGITDHKNSRYTQFIGMLLRSSMDTLNAFSRRLCDAENAELVDDGDESVAECSIRSRKSRKSRNRLLFSPPPNTATSPVSPTRMPESKGNGVKDASPKRNDSSIPRNSVITESPLEELESNKANGAVPATSESDQSTDQEGIQEPKNHQSYLALTNLGMGKKKRRIRIEGRSQW
ncbi:unnamed protein product [Lepeophtheirus salmonis]|uniref:(salmon louse) hypothetical protein n=1 Tax=Lepeophtheirus salmonis TaxID=72036 RepID=A0A7R8D1S4_LEPSM|nr:unnamed protein product [Lepeophtheirus salmonis]CAF2998610.1 unnamed protein product [Lepeophtheirus salmonis]